MTYGVNVSLDVSSVCLSSCLFMEIPPPTHQIKKLPKENNATRTLWTLVLHHLQQGATQCYSATICDQAFSCFSFSIFFICHVFSIFAPYLVKGLRFFSWVVSSLGAPTSFQVDMPWVTETGMLQLRSGYCMRLAGNPTQHFSATLH